MKRIRWAVIALAFTVLAGAASAQFVASENEVRRQQRLMWLQMKRHTPLEPDPKVQQYIMCVANKVLAEVPREFDNIDWEIVVFDEEQPNALATVNGKIAVFNGILKVAETPDALAAVLGHEVAHVTQGHVMELAKKAARQEIWSTLGGAAVGGTDFWRGYLNIIAGLPFQREQETDADLVGLDYMAKAGFDPRASIALWRNMEAYVANQGGRRQASFMMTHPSEAVRSDNLVRALTPALIKFNEAREAGKRPACSL